MVVRVYRCSTPQVLAQVSTCRPLRLQVVFLYDTISALAILVCSFLRRHINPALALPDPTGTVVI
jgi:hypothetical protein